MESGCLLKTLAKSCFSDTPVPSYIQDQDQDQDPAAILSSQSHHTHMMMMESKSLLRLNPNEPEIAPPRPFQLPAMAHALANLASQTRSLVPTEQNSGVQGSPEAVGPAQTVWGQEQSGMIPLTYSRGISAAAPVKNHLSELLGPQLHQNLVSYIRDKVHGEGGLMLEARVEELCQVLACVAGGHAPTRPVWSSSLPRCPVWNSLAELRISVSVKFPLLLDYLRTSGHREREAEDNNIDKKLGFKVLCDFLGMEDCLDFASSSKMHVDAETLSTAGGGGTSNLDHCTIPLLSHGKEEEGYKPNAETLPEMAQWQGIAGVPAKSLSMDLRPQKKQRMERCSTPIIGDYEKLDGPGLSSSSSLASCSSSLPSSSSTAKKEPWHNTLGPALTAALERHLWDEGKIVCKRTVRKHIQIMPKIVHRVLQESGMLAGKEKEWLLNSKESLTELLEARRGLLHQIYKERGGKKGSSLDKATKKKRTSINHLLTFVGLPVMKEDYTDFIAHNAERMMARSQYHLQQQQGHQCGGSNSSNTAAAGLGEAIGGDHLGLEGLRTDRVNNHCLLSGPPFHIPTARASLTFSSSSSFSPLHQPLPSLFVPPTAPPPSSSSSSSSSSHIPPAHPDQYALAKVLSSLATGGAGSDGGGGSGGGGGGGDGVDAVAATRDSYQQQPQAVGRLGPRMQQNGRPMVAAMQLEAEEQRFLMARHLLNQQTSMATPAVGALAAAAAMNSSPWGLPSQAFPLSSPPLQIADHTPASMAMRYCAHQSSVGQQQAQPQAQEHLSPQQQEKQRTTTSWRQPVIIPKCHGQPSSYPS